MKELHKATISGKTFLVAPSRNKNDATEKGIKCYISVPITGWDMKLVKTWIGQAKEELVKNGYVPVSPLDVNPDQCAPYSSYMGRAIEALLECDAVYFIRGWQTSEGCNAEFEVAKIYNKKLMFE